MNTTIRPLINVLSKPAVSDFLRNSIEFHFLKQKEIIRAELFPLSPEDKVIDVGCGTGIFSHCFPSAQYVGVDIDEINVAYARARHQRIFVHADATQLPFSDASFSHGLIIGMLHHLSTPDASQALRELARVLAPNGHALIMEDTKSPRFFTRLLHTLGQGNFIRTVDEWHTLLSTHFHIEKYFTFYNGICYYTAFTAKKL